MILTFAVFALFIITIALVQFSLVAVSVLIVVLALGISGLIALIQWIANGRGIFSERKYGTHI